jgi:undecaprenyl-diphosphatase
MNALHAAILGALQGLTEILPISSSAHLILVPWLFHWPESGLTFDVALHLGTFIALCLYFWRDIMELTVTFFNSFNRKGIRSKSGRLPFCIIVGTIPAGLVGKVLEGPIEEIFRNSPATIAIFLIVFGLLLAFADEIGSKSLKMDRITFGSSLLIGLAQCLALVPGVSRSGITITAGLLLGFKREAAARFSFLLSLPIVAGAALFKLIELLQHGIPAEEIKLLLIGVSVSAVVGYFSVAFLLKFIQNHSLSPFVWYRLLAGAGILFYLFLA